MKWEPPRALSIKFLPARRAFRIRLDDNRANFLRAKDQPALAGLDDSDLERVTIGFDGSALCLDEKGVRVQVEDLVFATGINKTLKGFFWEVAHAHCFNNRSEIASSELCGCFNCLASYPPGEIKKWVKEAAGEETALCPRCGIDAVIGSSFLEFDEAFLRVVQEIWFSVRSN